MRERELRPNRNCDILTPSLMAVNVVFLVLQMLNRRPRGPLCWVMAFFTASNSNFSGLQLNRGPRAPSAWCGFPYHSSSITPSPTLTGTLTSVLTELYNSSSRTQSPTRSLEWHDWSSSSGNNCHAVLPVHQSMSVPWEFFLPRPISSANFRPRDFLS